MPNATDEDLTVLLTKLYDMQEDVGAKPKSTTEEKRKAAENVATMGKGRAAKKSGSRFLELKSSIVTRLKTIHKLVEAPLTNDAKATIAAQAEIREQIRQAQEEWEEIDGLYKNEARKRKSKFTKEELEVQETLVYRLQAEIDKLKEASLKGYARGNQSDATAANMNTAAMATLNSNQLFASNEGEGHLPSQIASLFGCSALAPTCRDIA